MGCLFWNGKPNFMGYARLSTNVRNINCQENVEVFTNPQMGSVKSALTWKIEGF